MARIGRRLAGAVAGTMVLVSAAVTQPALAQQATPTAACQPQVGGIASDGSQYAVDPVFEPGKVRVASDFTVAWYNGYAEVKGWVIQGDSAYYREYAVDTEAHVSHDWPDYLIRVGGGWTTFKALEVGQYPNRTTAYGLRGDGVLFRWRIVGHTWKAAGSAQGFAAVKSMAMISKTATYETFLANTRGGALYTIRIPISSPMKPIVKPVRTRTWQGFEKLIASKCGNYGTLLVGIDTDTKTAYKYAVGHANGLSTVMQGLGKLDGTYPAGVYHRYADPVDPLSGD